MNQPRPPAITTQPAYLEIRQAALDNQIERRKETNSDYAYGVADRTIGGVEFACRAIRQSYNGATAVQVLHFIGGRKVSKAAFLAALQEMPT